MSRYSTFNVHVHLASYPGPAFNGLIMYTKWVLSIYIIKCLYVYCNFVEIIRGEGGNLGGELSPPEGPEKNSSVTLRPKTFMQKRMHTFSGHTA